jgi:hypothetical protein
MMPSNAQCRFTNSPANFFVRASLAAIHTSLWPTNAREIPMSFKDQIRTFCTKANEALEAKKREVENNAKKVLHDLLGDEVSQIQSISLDADVGKFHSVVAPERVLAKLREANLLKLSSR